MPDNHKCFQIYFIAGTEIKAFKIHNIINNIKEDWYTKVPDSKLVRSTVNETFFEMFIIIT